MPRQRLTPEEREARRRERVRFSFSAAAYQHYNPETEGFGNPEQWEEVARKMFGLSKLKKADPKTHNKWLLALGLESMPETLEALKKAFKTAMFKAHPDYGGTNAGARAVMEAFATL